MAGGITDVLLNFLHIVLQWRCTGHPELFSLEAQSRSCHHWLRYLQGQGLLDGQKQVQIY